MGQIRLSDWLKFEILASDWSLAKPMPYTTSVTFRGNGIRFVWLVVVFLCCFVLLFLTDDAERSSFTGGS